MYRKDHLLSEIEKLAQVIAKLLGLKNDGRTDEANQLYEDTLAEKYELTDDEISHLSDNEFKSLIEQKAYHPDKLNILAQLIYYKASGCPETDVMALSLYRKTLVIFDILEQKHHVQSFENINLRNKINQLLKQYHA